MSQDLRLAIRISADGSAQVVGETEKVGDALTRLKSGAEGAGGAAGGLASAPGGLKAVATPLNFALAALGALMVPAVRAFAEGEEVSRRLAASLEIAGGRAARSAVEVEGLALQVSRFTRFTDEGVKMAAATLTRFDSVSGATFDRAIRLSADLAEALGQDVPQAAETLGRALENATGATMLRRMGLLNDEQAEAVRLMHDLGQGAQAQEAVFAALESRVGGLAGKMGNEGLAGAWSQLKNEIGESLEGLGKAVVEFTNLEGILRGLTDLTRDFNSGGIAKIVDVLSGTQFSYADSFRRGDAAAAAQESKWDDIATQSGRTALAISRERAAYLAEQDKQLGELIVKEDRHAKSLMTKGDVARAVTEAWARGNQILIDRYGTLDNAIAKITAAVVKQGAAVRDSNSQNRRDEMARLNSEIRAYEVAQDAAAKATKTAAAELAKLTKAYYEQLAIEDESIAQRRKASAQYEEATDQIGKTEQQIIDLTLARLQENKAILQRSEVNIGYIDAIDAEIAALERRKKVMNEQDAEKAEAEARNTALKASKAAEEEWARTAESISDSLTDALMRGFESGKDFAKNLRDTLYNLFRSLVLRPMIQAVVAPVAGMFSGGASAGGFNPMSLLGGGGGGGGGFDLSSMVGGLSNIGSLSMAMGGASMAGGAGSQAAILASQNAAFGGFGTTSTLSALGAGGLAGGVGSFLGGMATPFATLAGGFAGMGAGGAGFLAGAGGLMATLGAVVPIIGIGLAIAAALGAFERGGPKSGGSAGYGERFFTPNDSDTQMQQLVNANSVAYKQALAALGGTGTADFAAGFDADPRGTAGSRVSFAARVGDREVYRVADRDVGRDEGAVEEALTLESKRALLAALQASELPAQIARVLNSVAAEGATGGQVETLVAFGAAMRVALDASKAGVGADAIKAYEAATQSVTVRLRTMGSELVKLATQQDGSVEKMQALAVATADYRRSVTETLVAIRLVGNAVRDMIAQTRESIEFAGLDDQTAYDLARSRGNSLLAQIEATDNPADVQRLSERLNAYLLQAFNLLSPEEQLAKKPEFLAGLATLDAAVAAALARIGGAIEGGTEGPFAAVNLALETASVKFEDAADTQAGAADSFSGAVTRFEAAVVRLESIQIAMPTTRLGEVGAG